VLIRVARGDGDGTGGTARQPPFAARTVTLVTALRRALCLAEVKVGDQEWKRSFPILAVMRTLKLASAPEKQAMIPWRGTGAFVAATIARRSGWRSSLLDALFG
jgi:hypothetical protein